MSWGQFTAQPNGTRIYNHGYDQCVALANQYHEEVLGGTFVDVASAYQWWTNYGSLGQLQSKYTQAGSPVAGAVVVWRGGIYNAVDGHIGVVTSVNSNGTYNTMEQNAGTWRYLGRYTRNMVNVLGFLIPRNNPAGGGSSAIKSGDNELLMINKAGASPAVYAIFGTNFWLEFTGQDTANGFALQILNNGKSQPVSNDFWNYCKQAATASVKVSVSGSGAVDNAAIAKAVNDEIAKRMAN